MVGNVRSPQCTSIDIEFQRLSYTVPTSSRGRLKACAASSKNQKSSKTQILHEVSGQFRAGELTAVLGPSGAGKTSLLSILAGFRNTGVSGDVWVNSQRRDPSMQQKFRQQSCLIPQDFAMLDTLTARETLRVAALLKLGPSKSSQERDKRIADTSAMLGLDACMDTPVMNLSGGEKKRLSCGVELLSNPPLMFFDEPTSGLDTCSAYQMLSHLRTIAHQDHRNIVCSIHQPGSRLFQTFDRVFVLSRGRCVLHVPTERLVPTLADQGFNCPSFYNPADYVLEVASGERGDISAILKATASRVTFNKEEIQPEHSERSVMLNNKHQQAIEMEERSETEEDVLGRGYSFRHRLLCLAPAHLDTSAPARACTPWQQFVVLLCRAARCGLRDGIMMHLRLISHIFIGVLLGIIFYKIGNDAGQVVSNAGCIFFLVMFLFFSNAMPTVQTFPSEMTVMLREHLNGWYSVMPYYLARSIADLPMQLLCPTVFLTISYFLTGQYMDLRAFLQTLLVALLLVLTAQSLGMLVGAATDLNMGIFLIPVISIPMLLFSGYFAKLKAIPFFLHWLSHLSLFRYAFEATLVAQYGFGRPKLPCLEDYCHLRSPEKILEANDLNDGNYLYSTVALAIYTLVLRVLLYFVLKWRVYFSK